MTILIGIEMIWNGQKDILSLCDHSEQAVIRLVSVQAMRYATFYQKAFSDRLKPILLR